MWGVGEKKQAKIVGFDIPDGQYDVFANGQKQLESSGESSSQQKPDGGSGGGSTAAADPDENKYKKKTAEKLSTWSALFVLVYLTAIFGFVVYMDQRLPNPLTYNDVAANPDRFIEERARTSLKRITSVGARPAGSYENEVLAADFIRRELDSIGQRANPIHKLTVDIQKPRGSFNLGFVDGMTHHYKNIQNIIAKVESNQVSGQHALLVNCHFDSVPQSPGASDDAVSCSIMLEILEVLTQSATPLKHNLIFLFNGAEENMLPASHGFITQHMWAGEARAFINLEACGSGGRELVFQTGPAHPWLVEAYARVAPHPFASVIGQEVFQTGIIPSDTDFRIFRDHGNIPGLDIAYMKNGYVYHTKYDTEDRIPAGSIQRAGDNLLAVIRHLARESDILGHTDDHAQGSVVFFDVLGLFMVHYPEWLGIVLNFVVVAVSVFITYRKAISSFQYGVSTSVYVKQLGYTFFIQVVGCIASFVAVTMVAVVLDALRKTMSWYSKPYLICLLYMAPTMMSVIAVFHFALPRQKKFFQFKDGLWVIESLYFEVSKLVWTLYTLVMTLLRLKSSFFCMMWVLFPMAGRFILERIYDTSAVKKKPKDWKWLLIHMLSILIPLTLNMYLIYTTFVMFVPIMGRSGSGINPDLVIGYKAASMTLATMSFLCPLVMVMNRPNNVITTLYMTTIITAILVSTTKLGFPYSASPTDPAPQRSLFVHTDRQIFDKSGKLVVDDAGYFVVNTDRNSPTALMGWVPEFYTMKQISEKQCNKYLHCGMPVYYPATSMLKINHWIKTEKPRIYQEAGLKLIQTETPTPDTVKMLFEAKGPDHLGIFFSPEVGVTLKKWSFSDGETMDGPKWKDGRKTYYIFHSHGMMSSTFQFWLEFKTPRGYMAEHHDLMDIGINGHILHGNGMKSPAFKEFLAQFPAWSYPVGWTASYKMYKF